MRPAVMVAVPGDMSAFFVEDGSVGPAGISLLRVTDWTTSRRPTTSLRNTRQSRRPAADLLKDDLAEALTPHAATAASIASRGTAPTNTPNDT